MTAAATSAMRLIAAVLALGATACLKPPNKQTGYAVNGAVVAAGGLVTFVAATRDCNDRGFADGLDCVGGKIGGEVMGITLIAIGVVGLIATAASDAPDSPQ